MKLDVNVIVFIEPKGVPFVERSRRGRESRTKIYSTKMKDLEYYSLLDDIKKVMSSEEFQVSRIEKYALSLTCTVFV